MNTRTTTPSANAPSRNASGWLLGASLSAVLSLGLIACGGGTTASDSGAETKEATAAQSSPEQSAASVQAELSKGSALSTAELAAAEKEAEAADASGSAVPLEEVQEGQTVPKSAYASGEVARKAASVRIPVYRFVNPETGTYFLTADERERDKVRDMPSSPWRYEGESFSAARAFSPGLSPVHRFHNLRTGEYLYTISEAERAHVAARLPLYRYEGVAFYASPVGGEGLIAVERVVGTSGEPDKHETLVTKSAKLPNTPPFDDVAVGVGYFGFESIWKPDRLPHSGITDQQCYRAGSDTLVACGLIVAQALNQQQDGHRTAIRPMSYSAVQRQRPGLARPTYPITSCVKDNVTGLIWEGKTDDGGLRDKDNTYTNLGNGQANDASGYVAAVNAAHLCGYSDWRLPTRQELLGIVDYGRSVPSINTTWFPNTKSTGYWSSEGVSTDSGFAWVGSFDQGYSNYTTRSDAHAVRLVRGVLPSGPRFTYSTQPYGSDAANNVVNDAWTGLQWRRCEEGRTWSGSTCTGTASTYTHEQALAHARDQSGWRLPNVKELSSLVDLSVASGTRIDATAFPGGNNPHQWASSPYVDITDLAWAVYFDYGCVYGYYYRFNTYAVRLVRASQ